MTGNKAGETIKQILFKNDKPKSWLAGKLRISPQSLQYKLDNHSALSADLFEDIMQILRKEGFITSESEQCNYLVKQTLKTDALLSSTIEMLSETVKRFVDDTVLDFREKKELSILIDKTRTDLNQAFDDLELIIEGR